MIVDDAHTGTDVIRQFDARHDGIESDTPASMILAGVHCHAGLKDIPAGIRSLRIGPLDNDQAIEALARPLTHHDIQLPDGVLEDAALGAQGIPLAILAWGEQLWHTAHQDDSGIVDVQRLQRAVDGRVDRVYSTVWANLTDTDRNYLAAITTETGEPLSSSDAATNAGYDSPQQVSPARAKLIDQGILHAPARGQIQVAIAGFGRWYHQHRTYTTPGAKTQRIHHEPAAGPAAEPAPNHPHHNP